MEFLQGPRQICSCARLTHVRLPGGMTDFGALYLHAPRLALSFISSVPGRLQVYSFVTFYRDQLRAGEEATSSWVDSDVTDQIDQRSKSIGLAGHGARFLDRVLLSITRVALIR